ncbi:hypothetical protein ES703_79897 [subsurface metagenome]
MALVKYGGGVIQMAGSIAGNTFARNRSGNYVRARTKPINPNTDLQVAIRAAMAFLTERWSQTLDSTKRTAWNLYASSVAMKNALGEVIYLSGFNHYIRSNMIRKQSALAIIDDGPTIFELPEKDPILSIAASEAGPTITVTFDATLPWALETGAYLVKFQGQPQNPQRNFFGGPWRLMDNIAGVDSTGATTPDVETPVYAITQLQRLTVLDPFQEVQKLSGHHR